MKRAVLFLVVPLAVLVASLWAYQALSPTGLPRQQMTRAERAEAKQTAIAIAADVERKAQQRKAARKQQRLVETPKTLTTSTPVEVQRFATVEPQIAPEIESWKKPPEVTLPLEQLNDTFSHAFLAWNVQSKESDARVIADQLRQLPGYDVYCLTEVLRRSFPIYKAALPGYQAIESTSGHSYRMMILFNREKFELLEQKELHQLNNGSHRSPFYVRLRDKRTKTELIVMTNHLPRKNNDLRQKQAAGLREWARDQPVGVVNIGDFNMDYSFKRRKGNDAFPEMLRDNIWKWIPPEPLVDTQWSDRNGKDAYPNSMLDFAFVSGPAKTWNPQCRVIVREGDFPDSAKTSDHRPIELRLTLPKANQ